MLANLTGLLTLLLAGPGGAGAEPWTVERVLESVRSTDPAIAAARARGEAGRAQGASAWAGLSPQLRLQGSVLRSDDPALLFSEKLWQGRFTQADFDVQALNRPPARTAWQYGLVLDQPIFNGAGEVTTPALVGHLRRAATAAEQAAVGGLLLRAAETYAGAWRARRALEADSLSLEAALEQRRSAVARFRTGQVPELDTLLAAARLAGARAAWLGRQAEGEVAIARLSRLVGATVNPSELADPSAPAADAPLGEAADRGEVRAARERAAALEIESKRAGLRLLPSLNGRVTLNWYRDPAQGPAERRWMASLAMDLPVWDGARRVNEWRAAQAQARMARADAQAAERDLEVAAAGARAEADIAPRRFEAARMGRAAAEEGLRFAQDRYRAGLLPLSELLAADAEAAKARLGEVDARVNLLLTRYRHLHAIGELR
ncbi:MAG: TolC family protein [Candidatus Eisenbacteria bacterium]|nr:TolC family protein [Candidatus Eisenbacteria bacterium]